jgi:hypothetical protein
MKRNRIVIIMAGLILTLAQLSCNQDPQGQANGVDPIKRAGQENVSPANPNDGAGQSETQGAPAGLEQGSGLEVESFRIDCGSRDEEEQMAQGTQLASLVVMGDPSLKDVETSVPAGQRNNRRARQWHAAFDRFHDSDAAELTPIMRGDQIDGYRVVDAPNAEIYKKKPGLYRVVEFTGLAECLARKGGKGEDHAKATWRVLNQNDVKDVYKKKDFTPCTCEFEMKSAE